jgi:prolyl-tRNA editing enzyme YbaK/EbsC (Cys-tRNA(Pro) deacylase)
MIGKTLVLKADKDLVMVLVPGNKNLDLAKITRLLRQKADSARQGKISFVSEKVLKNKFKGVKLGAIPPFGEMWPALRSLGEGGKLPLFVDRGLMKEKNIFVSSGIYEASFKLSPKVFEKLGATLGNFSKAKK